MLFTTFAAALFLCITFQDHPAAVYYFLRGRLAYYVSGPPWRLLLIDAALLLRVTRQCRLVVFIARPCRPVHVYCFLGPPCCCLLFVGSALMLFITFRGRLAVVYYSSGAHCCCSCLFFTVSPRIYYSLRAFITLGNVRLLPFNQTCGCYLPATSNIAFVIHVTKTAKIPLTPPTGPRG